MQHPAKTRHRCLFPPSIVCIRFNTHTTGVRSMCFVQLLTQSYQYRCSHLDSSVIIIHVTVLILGLDDRLFKNLQTPCIPRFPLFLPFPTCILAFQFPTNKATLYPPLEIASWFVRSADESEIFRRTEERLEGAGSMATYKDLHGQACP